jgi:uncharacterized protein YjbI with pentapeptide repeats
VTATSHTAAGYDQNRVSQIELDEAIRLHGIWLADKNSGQRCIFGGRDLSGLRFGALGGGPIDLNGADFAMADLSGTEADDILVHHCSFNGANLGDSHWRRPTFAFADMRRASAKKAIWGTPARRGSTKRFPADFSHTVLNDADLSEARICGYFYGAKLARVSMVRANFSFSDFLGPIHHEMTFARANLSKAKLRHCHVSSVNLSNADCSRVDFSRTVFSDLIVKDCNFGGAVFRGTEFERAVFSPHHIQDLELRRVMTSAV